MLGSQGASAGREPGQGLWWLERGLVWGAFGSTCRVRLVGAAPRARTQRARRSAWLVWGRGTGRRRARRLEYSAVGGEGAGAAQLVRQGAPHLLLQLCQRDAGAGRQVCVHLALVRLSYRQLLRRQRKLLHLGAAPRDEVPRRQLAPLQRARRRGRSRQGWAQEFSRCRSLAGACWTVLPPALRAPAPAPPRSPARVRRRRWAPGAAR